MELAECVESAQVATETLYKDWKLAENPRQNRLNIFLSSTQSERENEKNEKRAGVKFLDQGELRNSDS